MVKKAFTLEISEENAKYFERNPKEQIMVEEMLSTFLDVVSALTNACDAKICSDWLMEMYDKAEALSSNGSIH